uniref:Pyridine nucleotide-disulfide oxidoreductase domain-containing protein 2 n=1 Tax=Anolis carolinensis TaxID=28377 RepID=G1KBU8_ANOCA|nr:PREDICTED: pyridine nucleotide-disulfide oxidoreductase domain-containing protein 2 isoform X1 [Anolis carolinensis]|eukprot:XP_008104719.1 PREDICTED: pyridine nucleotide-disulfide oxidoreductase domain-containing protein 2 isoform X1 [Anolis carolinensis]
MASRCLRGLGAWAGTSLPSWGCSRASHAGSAAAPQREYDAVVIGAGHNGLVAAAYLQKGGLKTAVLERRHIVGGAAVTEEIIPGFHFSRASYLLSLLRPQIYEELELKRHGLQVLPRDPYSFTPLLEDGQGGRPPRSLLLGNNMAETQKQIAQFSAKDAQAFPKYEAFMSRLVSAIDPLLDTCPVDVAVLSQGSLFQRLKALQGLRTLIHAGFILGKDLPQYYEVLTAPISKILDFWFESEPLKATLATDAVIGAMASPHTPGSGYVLLHHVMGQIEGWQGAWGYVTGGMGALSQALARAATELGAEIFTEKKVAQILQSSDGKVRGVCLKDGTEVKSRLVLSNASPQLTFLELTPQDFLPAEFVQRISQFDTRSPVTKINVAVDRLPNFLAAPNSSDGRPSPHHQSSIHLNCEDIQTVHQAFEDACQGRPSCRPMIELCIPSALDPTLAPQGCHVVSLFTQYTPYTLAGGKQWDQQESDDYADQVFDCIEAYAPGFKASVIGRDVLTPPDLERIFGLPGGNIFHGAMSLDQLYFARPVPSYSGYRSPVQGLYLCGSGAHPGGGVMGAPGRNAARTALEDFKNV